MIRHCTNDKYLNIKYPTHKYLAHLTAALCLLFLHCTPGMAQGMYLEDPQGAPQAHIGELSDLDQQFMERQRSLLRDLAGVKLGRRFNGDRNNDLDILQALLDRGLVKGEQTQALQAMGIVMGDLLAGDLDMHWVVYEDDIGRSRALRYKKDENVLFPVTMIARRREVGNEDSVAVIYAQARDTALRNRAPLPFQ